MKEIKRKKYYVKIPHSPHYWLSREYDTKKEAEEALEYYKKQKPHVEEKEINLKKWWQKII